MVRKNFQKGQHHLPQSCIYTRASRNLSVHYQGIGHAGQRPDTVLNCYTLPCYFTLHGNVIARAMFERNMGNLEGGYRWLIQDSNGICGDNMVRSSWVGSGDVKFGSNLARVDTIRPIWAQLGVIPNMSTSGGDFPGRAGF